MNKLYIQDRQTYQVTQRVYTDEGFLRVPGRVAKTGTQEYLRRELGLDGNPNEVVTVYRPPEEVFDEASLASYDTIDITVLHPKELVNAKNFKTTSVGVVRGPGRRDGDFVVADLIFKDYDAIKNIEEKGYVELSGGYTAEYVAMDGIAPNGKAYQFIQRGIIMNHMASLPVNAARAGPQARIFDEKPHPKGTTMKSVVLDSGRSVEIQDEAIAALVTESIERLTKTVDAAKKSEKEAKDEAEREKARADAAEEEAAKKKGETSDSVIAERIAQITEVKDKAKEIEANYVADGIDTMAIMRGVLSTVRPTKDWAAQSDEYVRASFDLAHENSKAGVSGKSTAQKRQLAADASTGVTQPTNVTKMTPHQAYAARFTKTQAGA